MKKITSLFDFFQKVKTDDRYKEVARFAYTYRSSASPTRFRYVDAELWIKEWIKSNKDDTCKRMVDYLNDCMVKLYPVYKEAKPVPQPSTIIREVRPPPTIDEIVNAQQSQPTPSNPILTQEPISTRYADCPPGIIIQNNYVEEEGCVETEEELESPLEECEEECDG